MRAARFMIPEFSRPIAIHMEGSASNADGIGMINQVILD